MYSMHVESSARICHST